MEDLDLKSMINYLTIESMNECTCIPEHLMGLVSSECGSCHAERMLNYIQKVVKEIYNDYREVYK